MPKQPKHAGPGAMSMLTQLHRALKKASAAAQQAGIHNPLQQLHYCIGSSSCHCDMTEHQSAHRRHCMHAHVVAISTRGAS
jgi:hypothetical protein